MEHNELRKSCSATVLIPNPLVPIPPSASPPATGKNICCNLLKEPDFTFTALTILSNN